MENRDDTIGDGSYEQKDLIEFLNKNKLSDFIFFYRKKGQKKIRVFWNNSLEFKDKVIKRCVKINDLDERQGEQE